MDTEGLFSRERKCEILGVVLLIVTTCLFLSLLSAHHEPQTGHFAWPPWEGANLLRQPGALVANVLAFLLGDAAHVIYAITFIWMLKLFNHQPVDRLMTRLFGVLLLTGALAGLLHINLGEGASNAEPGGMFGAFIADQILVNYFAKYGSNIIGIVLAFMGALLATDFLFIHFLLATHRVVRFIGLGLFRLLRLLWRGARWLVSDASESETSEAPEAAQPAAPVDTTAQQLPAEDVPATVSPWRSAGAFLVGLLGHFIPRFTWQENVPATAEGPALPLDDADASDAEPEAVRAPLRVHLTPPESLPDVPESPFGDVPDPAGTSEPLPTDRMPESTEAPDDAPDAGDWDDEHQVEPPPAAADSVPEEAEVNAAESPAPEVPDVEEILAEIKPKPAVPRLRRTAKDWVELPDNYEYPGVYTHPPLDLFTRAERRIIPNLREKLGNTATRLEETLRTFGIEAEVTDVTRGPTITRFELKPAPGMKVSRFLSLTDDIALRLKARGVRVEAPIPGKGRVGIEVSNDECDAVVLRELLEHSTFKRDAKGLQLALGKDIAGAVCIADLVRMPHLLVAGATGAGKTVCIKALLASLLYQHTPDQLQLMLIDPKMVELSIFNDIPHLITPVVTDPKKASLALTWLITEMEERYRLFADLRVRNIEVYNESVENGEIELEDESGKRRAHAVNVVRKLPYIVCVIDELADLMMLARAEVEDAIARLAQLARAVGIHLIIATQRPSVDVLTGVIKANFPARISFQVSSRVDSRCILDEIGAERLIGMGDMLYLPAGQSKPSRIQGAFVSDHEMMTLIAHLKRQAPPQYRDEIENFGKNKDAVNELDFEDDPLFEDAVRVVLDTGQASISMVQRRLRVGYTRAARLIDMMELKGIVGPHTGSKAREILVRKPPEDEEP